MILIHSTTKKTTIKPTSEEVRNMVKKGHLFYIKKNKKTIKRKIKFFIHFQQAITS